MGERDIIKERKKGSENNNLKTRLQQGVLNRYASDGTDRVDNTLEKRNQKPMKTVNKIAGIIALIIFLAIFVVGLITIAAICCFSKKKKGVIHLGVVDTGVEDDEDTHGDTHLVSAPLVFHYMNADEQKNEGATGEKNDELNKKNE